MNAAHPQSSMLLNINDPIQVHLLVETALGDSKQFEILSPEEVDDLKKQVQTLTQRIAQTRQNLAIQAKMRGAAMSIAKLYSNGKNADGTGEKKHRRSLLGSRSSNSEQATAAEQERVSSERKSEELAIELWSLERRLMEPQRRLLQHTAGILQMTHKGPAKVQKGSAPIQQGMPGSPESMYTYSNARSSMDPPPLDEDLFDERSLYRMFDRFDGPGLGVSGARDSWDNSAKSREQSEHIKTISKTEQKFESLNVRLRDVIVKANPDREKSYGRAPSASQNEMSATPGKLLASHLDYLEKGLDVMEQEHGRLKQDKEEGEMAMEETMEELNREIRDILMPFDSERPEPPELTGKSLPQQLNYLQNSMGAIENELQRAVATSAGSKNIEAQQKSFEAQQQSFEAQQQNFAAQQDSLDQMEAVLTGLWEVIQAGEEDIRKRKLQRRQTRQQNGAGDDESSGEEIIEGSAEPFSLQAFSAKVQWLFAQTTSLRDQKKVLQRQIKQQRELNSKGEGEKDGQITQLSTDLERTQSNLDKAEREVRDVQIQLQQVMERLDEARRESTQRGLEKARKDNDESAAIVTLEAKLSERNDEIMRLEEEIQDMKDDQNIGNAEIQSRLAESQAKIDSLTAGIAKAEEDAPRLKKEINDKEEEIETANMEIARLQTEVTIARAELDGAYGSRAQRAAEVAANPAIMKEIEDLRTRNRTLDAEVEKLKASGGGDGSVAELRRELSETIEEYEVMTKASIEWEKEREQLEREVDKLRDERESLEQKLGDEQVKWLGMKSPSAPGAPGEGVGAGATSTAVLKNEFKKMMRDTRAENTKALRVSSSISQPPLVF